MKIKFVALIPLVFTIHFAWADTDRFSVSTGFDYSSGKYGSASTTNIFSIPVVGKYETGPWLFKLTIPYLKISGSGGVVPGVGRYKIIATTPKTTTQSGLGDMVAAVTYNLYEGDTSTPGVDLIGRVKLATAGTGLGTGQNDYAVQADVYQSFGKFTPMGSLGYKFLGSPSGVTMNRAAYVSFGAAYQFTDQTSGGADMDLSQSSSATSAGQRELTVYLSHKIDKNFKIQGYVLKGFSNGSPDRGIGVLATSIF